MGSVAACSVVTEPIRCCSSNTAKKRTNEAYVSNRIDVRVRNWSTHQPRVYSLVQISNDPV